MPLRQLLGIEHPIIQAPMVGVSTPALAVAVSEAGALGSIGLGASNPAQARELIAQVRALTARLVNFNLFCHRPGQADAAREAAWVEHLRPLFEELGGEPPAALREIYRSFVDDPQMLEVLLEERPAVVLGDFNVIPEDKDTWSVQAMATDALAQPETRDAYFRLLNDGWTDAIDTLNPRGGVWTYWDYQAGAWQRDHGFRIDHILLSPECADRLIAAGVDKDYRGHEKASDHAPIWVELRD